MASTDGQLISGEGRYGEEGHEIDFDVINESFLTFELVENKLYEELDEPDEFEDDEECAAANGSGASDIYIQSSLYQEPYSLGITNEAEGVYPITTPSTVTARASFQKEYLYLFSQLAKEYDKIIEDMPDEKIRFEAIVNHFIDFPYRIEKKGQTHPVVEMVNRLLDTDDLSFAIDRFNKGLS